MRTLSRRNFLKASGAALAAAGILGACGGSSSSTAPSSSVADTQAASMADTMAATEANTEEAPATMDFSGTELVVATWGWAEAGLQNLAEEFCNMYGCSILVDPTPGNGPRLNKLMAEKDDPQADVALLTKSFADTGNTEGLFEMMDTNVVTSLSELYDFAQEANGYGPCYSLCRYGIMYNADLLASKELDPPTSYQDLFDDKYAHLVALPAMSSTACPYMLVAMEEAMGGTQEDVSDAFKLMQDKKDNIDIWYTTSSDVQNAFTNEEIAIAVFMDINMASLSSAGLNMVWVDPAEGTIGAPAAINVVKGCKNPELAQLFVQYVICKETQDRVAEAMDEAPTNMNASMPEEKKTYLAFGEESIAAIKQFDDAYINSMLAEWIETFDKTVAVQ